MTTARMLGELRKLGASLNASGDRVAFVAPKGVMTPDRISDLRKCKSEMIALLADDYMCAAIELLVTVPGHDDRLLLAEVFDERVRSLQAFEELEQQQAIQQAYAEMAATIDDWQEFRLRNLEKKG